MHSLEKLALLMAAIESALMTEEQHREHVQKMFDEDPEGFKKTVNEVIEREGNKCEQCEGKETCILYAIHTGKLIPSQKVKQN